MNNGEWIMLYTLIFALFYLKLRTYLRLQGRIMGYIVPNERGKQRFIRTGF